MVSQSTRHVESKKDVFAVNIIFPFFYANLFSNSTVTFQMSSAVSRLTRSEVE